MFTWWGRIVTRWRWLVLALTGVFAAVAVGWGMGVFDALSSGGFEDPDSESYRAYERINDELGNQDIDLLVLYASDTARVEDPAFREPVTATLAEVSRHPAVASVVSWYDTQAPTMLAADGQATYAAIQLVGSDEDAKLEAYHEVEPLLDAPGVETQVGGLVAFLAESSEQTERDIFRAELLSAPVLLLLLVLIFRGLVAATTPLLVGGLAILGGFLTTRLLTLATEISVFAINIITVIGVGLAIDYALFVVSRFREELAAGRPTGEAIQRTLATAGRTVMVSGLTIALALASLLIFPQAFLRSMAFGGMSAVLVAMLASLTVLPALLTVLGKRINAGRVPLPWRRRASESTEGGWARLARSVMRRPVWYAVGVVVVLALLAAPALRMQFGGYDIRVLPEGAEPRVVSETLERDFPDGTTDPISVFVAGAPAAEVQAYAERLAALPEVASAAITAQQGDAALISLGYPGEPTGDAAIDALDAVRDTPAPASAEVLVGGRTANDQDLLASLGDRLPWMALLIAVTIMLVLFLAFGSVVLPVKAVVMNLVSIGASFGVLVWVFQDGHLSDWLGFTPTGFIEPTMPILMLALLFGLSTDYEVFLLSRIREEWDRTGENATSVAVGLQRTGRIITAAALLLVIVVGGFAAGEMAYIKLVGVGTIVAIVVDATLVRALLVPATMRLLGRWNWWAPGPLGRVYRRYGFREDGAAGPASSNRADLGEVQPVMSGTNLNNP
ncbi:MAG TPA: MMPL family transporter [Natronosporangium sp.]